MQSNNIVNQKEYEVTQEEIISMAREALLPSDELYHSNLVRFAALVAAAERKACAHRVGIALLGADRGLTDRVNQSIQSKGV